MLNVTKRMSNNSIQGGDFLSPQGNSRQAEIVQNVFSQKRLRVQSPRYASGRPVSSQDVNVEVNQTIKGIGQIELKQNQSQKIQKKSNTNSQHKRYVSATQAQLGKESIILKEEESEDLPSETSKISRNYEQMIKKKLQNYSDVKTLQVDLFKDQGQKVVNVSRVNLSGEYESMYAKSVRSQQKQNILGTLKKEIRNKMSHSDRMIFETQQLKRANAMIMNQPDRRPHDYSRTILHDKFPVLSTYEDQEYHKRAATCNNNIAKVSAVSGETENEAYSQQNETGLDLTPLADKGNPWDTIWSGIRKWREKNVQYEKLDIQPYEITSADLTSDAFGMSLSKSKKFENRDIDNNMDLYQNTSNINIQIHYEEVFDTGEKFLRIATRQWTNGFDPKSPKKDNQIQYEIHTLRCYKYCQSTEEEFLINEFELQHSSVYDISEQRLSIEDGAFSNDFFVPFRNHTFFFKRAENGFQLVRQSMMDPQSLPGPTKDQACEVNSDVHEIKNYFIKIDNPENYQINFIQPASKRYSLQKEQSKSMLEFLTGQFVIIKEKRYLNSKKNIDQGRVRIYALNELGTPLIDEVRKTDFCNIQAAFQIEKVSKCPTHPQDDTIIIIRCSHSEHEIFISHLHNKNDRTIKIKNLSRDAYKYRRYLTHQIKIVHTKVNLDDGSDPFDQAYAVSIIDSNYMPFPIYPLHQEREKGKIGYLETYNACQQIQKIFRKNFAGSPEGQIIFDEDNHFQNVTDSHKNQMFYELKVKENQLYHSLDQYIATNTTIIKANVFQGIIHTWLTFRDHTFSNFHDQLQELNEYPEGHTFKKRLYQQFSRSNNTKYQNNFLNCSTDKDYIPNMNLQPMYIHQSKKNVMSYHNKLFVNEKCFEFHEKYLLIDVNQKGGMFIKIQLFDNETKDIRLIKYHSDPKSQKVVLFFLQRNYLNKNLGNNFKNVQSGVYFFTVTTFGRLNQQSNNHNLASYLLSKETTIQVLVKKDKFIKMKYDPEKLTQFQNYGKSEEETLNHLAFDMVHDMLNPVQKWLPFILSDLNSDSVESYLKSKTNRDRQDKYSTYLCFMNLDKYKLLYEEQDDKEDQNNPQEIIQTYYMQQFVNNTDEKKCIKTLHRYNQSNAELSLSMFTRCSNWQENIYQPNSGSFSARFQIGLSNRKQDVQVIESQEMIVTLQDDTMKIEPVALRHIFPSRELYEYCQMNKEKTHLHRFVPEIDDNGNISGSSMMVCVQVFFSYKKINPAIKNADQENLNDQVSLTKLTLVEDYFSVGKLFGVHPKHYDFIENRLGAKVEVIGESAQNVEVQFEDNFRKIISKSMLQEFKGNNYVVDAQQIEYGIIPLYGDKEINLKTPLMQMGYRKYVLLNRANEFMLVHTSRVNQKIMKQQVFDKNELLFELYRSQKINITMSHPNFGELTALGVPLRQKVYFQHRYIFNGRNYCGIDLPHYKSDIDVLKGSLSDSCLNKSLIEAVPNSCFKFFSGQKALEKNPDCDQRVEILFNLFDCNRMHNFQLNLNNESFLQKCLENNYSRALYYLLEFILKKKNDIIFQDVIMTDLPQLISQEKVPILEFFTTFDDENDDEDELIVKSNDDSKKNSSQKDFINIETKLRNNALPFLGTDEQMFSEFKSFDNIFNIQKEIEREVIMDAKNKQSQLENQASEQELMAIQENQQEIEHDYINFQPTIRKIKIDKFMNRKANNLKGTSYLEKFDDNVRCINGISDLFLADMMEQRQDAPEFYAYQSVQKLIDRQYAVTKDVIFKLLVIYLIGFIIPFAINISGTHQDNFWITTALTTSGVMTQILFVILEYPEFKYRGAKTYLQSPSNYVDTTQIVFYTGRVILNQWVTYKHNYIMLVRNILTIICLLQSIIKLLNYIKYKEQFCFLVKMLTQVFKDLYPFMTIFMLNVYVFAMVDFVMENDTEGEEYKSMSRTFSSCIKIFRNSIGDISPVSLTRWKSENINGDPMLSKLATGIVWSFWFINVFTMTIVLLNFVIAEVGNTYNDIKESGDILLYQQKAQMNFVAQNIRSFFGKPTQFVALVFSTPKSMSQSNHENDELKNFSINLKQDIHQILMVHQQEILRSQLKYDDNLKELNQKMEIITKCLIREDEQEIKKKEVKKKMKFAMGSLQSNLLERFMPKVTETATLD